ncbi:allophanate hydrolase 2 subunit 2 [Aquitalea magnusonii]|uniref:Allophanate hydrolase 2 subunit 2 n=1 Tax=Aquitalea magnusonii TaxID=332411 RepID=A0A3G9GG90_9NEIS|nr:biotin-dependent carboxyltransferase family protein [Aquitalea magnusonii]BBF85853.1 allophanate hydrolase 2 subunit 2 [Aquitalea magnusonii]
MHIKVIKPGLATSVQDAGRNGYYHLGIPPSGALDQYSFRAANLLLGNAETAAVLECTLLGPQLQFSTACQIAICGAAMQPRINGQPQAVHQVLSIAAGDTLDFLPAAAGMRAYLAVSGGIDLPAVLDSRSTYALGGLGGYQGRCLQAGDILPLVAAPPTTAPVGRTLPAALQATLPRKAEVRVLPGLYAHRLCAESAARFYQDQWRVSSESDRIGYRLKGGAPLQFQPREAPFGAGADPSNIVDAGYPIGSIQVPSGKEPIILLRDAVSGGGYAMIGTVISADLDMVGQLQPNQGIMFTAVDMQQALQARQHYQAGLQQLRQALLDG